MESLEYYYPAFKNIISQLDYDSLIAYCQSHSDMANMCRHPWVWERLLKEDFDITSKWKDPREEYLAIKKRYDAKKSKVHLTMGDMYQLLPSTDSGDVWIITVNTNDNPPTLYTEWKKGDISYFRGMTTIIRDNQIIIGPYTYVHPNTYFSYVANTEKNRKALGL